jgi:hypothetical protein
MPVASLFAEPLAPYSRGCGILGIAILSQTFFFLFATVRGQSIRKEKRMAVDESSSGAPREKAPFRADFCGPIPFHISLVPSRD